MVKSKKLKPKKNLLQQVRNYFQEVVAETRKISWPSRQETIRLTLIVISTSILVSILVSLFDYIFNLILDLSF